MEHLRPVRIELKWLFASCGFLEAARVRENGFVVSRIRGSGYGAESVTSNGDPCRKGKRTGKVHASVSGMSDGASSFRRGVQIVGICAAVFGAAWLGWFVSRWLAARPVRTLNAEVDNLFEAFHKYKEHVGHYPEGRNADIVKALSGNNPKKVIILAIKREHINDKGEIVDPWGTPLKIYFAENEVLIRSAGPNRQYEDSKLNGGDDYFRSD
jgi:hypothetical protein